MMTNEKLKEYMKNSVIDFEKSKRIIIRLLQKNESGELAEEIEIKDIVDSVAEYVENNKNDHNSHLYIKVAPLMVHSLLCSLDRIKNTMPYAAFLLLSDEIKNLLTTQMLHSWYIVKFMEKNNIHLIHEEELLSKEETELTAKLGKISHTIGWGITMGIKRTQTIAIMLHDNMATKEELNILGIPKEDIEEAEKIDVDSLDVKQKTTATSDN